MIIGVIGGMVLHNLIVFRKKLILHRIGQPRILFRMTLGQRSPASYPAHQLLHPGADRLCLALSVIVAGGGVRQRSGAQHRPSHRRSGADRASACSISGTSVKTPDGRRLIKDMLPDWKDVTDARDAFRYYLGYSDQRPLFRRFTYAEKAEYWALVWGMFVMAGTGLMAWFKVGVGGRVPGWWVDVALTIHWYEAILATLAIVVWHLYGVIFDPDAYPMNWAWYDGKMSIEHYEHEHPLDLLAIEKAKGSEEVAAAAEPVKAAVKEQDETVGSQEVEATPETACNFGVS